MAAQKSKKRKNKDIDNDEEKFNLDSETYFLDHLISPFEMPNLTIKIEDKKLFVKKEYLMAVSPVFDRMFSSDFKESTATEITLPGKKLNHFVHFLRNMLPGFPDALTEHTIHHILPLAEEYQVDELMKRIDEFLAKQVDKQGDIITSKQIIKNILEAQQYNLFNYLDKCISVASRKKIGNLESNQCFNDIDSKIQLQICMKRCKEIDSIFNNAENGFDWFGIGTGPNIQLSEVGNSLKPFMQSN